MDGEGMARGVVGVLASQVVRYAEDERIGRDGSRDDCDRGGADVEVVVDLGVAISTSVYHRLISAE